MYINNNTDNWKKINQTTFNFAEENPDRGSVDTKKKCNVKCFDFFFFLCLFDGRHGWKKSQST